MKSGVIIAATATLGILAAGAQTVAFPGAEGFGRFASGGRGGAVIKVTNLNDSGAGSLRAAVGASGARTIIFEIAGTIHLQSTLRITHGDLTIAGQSAPGGGICLAGYPLDPSGTSNVILRFLRSRLGDTAALENDSFNCRHATDVIIDHCSFSWGIDETATSYDNTCFTMQWCIISESLRDSVHDKGLHGYGGIWGGLGSTFHHNLIAHHDSRNPRLNGARYHGTDGELVDFRNNVIYNWRSNSCYGGEPASATIPSRQNLVNNYYRYGPATASSIRGRILNPSAADGNYGLFHVSGNHVHGYPAITADNWDGGVQGPSSSQRAAMRVANAFPVAPVITQAAVDCYPLVLAKAGCVMPLRDSVDTRIAHEAATGTVTHTGSRGGLQGIIDSQTDVGGWPALAAGTAPADTDGDGMPDAWELANNLDSNNPADRNLTDAAGYTRLENYLNSLAAAAFPVPEISSQPASQAVPAGAPFTLSVTATGIGPISYQWLKNGEEIDGETQPDYQVDAATAGDATTYQVEIGNSYGTVTSSDAVITLTGPAAPSIVAGPSDVTVYQGEPALLEVAVAGSGELEYQWFRGSGIAIPGATSANLPFPAVSLVDAGTYYLTVTNTLGSATSAPARVSVRMPVSGSTLFSTTFAGNTIHAGSPVLTSSVTNWHIMSSKNATFTSVGDDPSTSGVTEARPLTLTMSLTSSGITEAAAFFTDPPAPLDVPGRTLRMRLDFTPLNVRTLAVGLFDSGGSTPHTGLANSLLVNSSSSFANGGTREWRGYRLALLENSTTHLIDARPAQPGTNNASQALVVPGTSSSFPVTVATEEAPPGNQSFVLTDNLAHSLDMEIHRISAEAHAISWSLEAGGQVIATGSAVTARPEAAPAAVTSVFDAVGIGYRNRDNSGVSQLIVHHLELTSGKHDLVADPYAAFLHPHGIDPADSFGDDADGDSISNGLEFVMGTDPSQASAASRPLLEGGPASGWTIRFPMDPGSAESTDVQIERSTNLVDWEVYPYPSETTPAEAGLTWETYFIPAADGLLYFRLKASRK